MGVMKVNFEQLYKSVLEQDTAPVVLCDTDHVILYMNPAAAEHYKESGGYDLVGKCVLECHNRDSREKIEKVLKWFRDDVKNNRVFTFRNEKENKDVYMVALRDDEKKLIGYYEKHEYREKESGGRYDFR